MSQFRLTGTRYLSQWGGDDLNAGTDPTLPKKTIASAAITTSIILGTGVYNGVYTGQRTLIGDGLAVVDFQNTSVNNTATQYFENIYLKNHNAQLGNRTGGLSTFKRCILEDMLDVSFRELGLNNHSNVFLPSPQPFLIPNPFFALANSIILEDINQTTATSAQTFSCNYIDNGVIFNCTLALTLIENCCINGKIRRSGVDYELKKLIDGSTRPDADGAIADIVSLDANFYTRGNFACLPEDVKFIDVISRTVESDSILLQKSNANGFIGGVKVGRKIDLDESGFTITKTGIDDTNPNYWKIAAGQPFAKIRITGKVSDSLISAQNLEIRIPFNFDGDAAGNTANNNNVPDAWNDRTTPDTKGTKPNRLTFEVRSSTLANPSRDVSADWDNDSTNSPSVPGRYYLMEYGQAMLHHIVSGTAYGNADANAINASVKQPFNYRSLDIIITITDTREI